MCRRFFFSLKSLVACSYLWHLTHKEDENNTEQCRGFDDLRDRITSYQITFQPSSMSLESH
jgi:hypothetical protein